MKLLRFLFIFIFLFTVKHSYSTGIHGIEGPKVVRSISIEGNVKTIDQTILRELSFKLGEKSYGTHINKRRSYIALTNLNLFNSIWIGTNTVGDSIDIEVKVVEKWYTWPLPFIEFADRNFNQWYQFDFSPDRTNYGLYFFKYNNFGRNQTLKLSLVAGYTDHFGIEYRIPYFKNADKWGLELRSSLKRNHEIWLTSVNDQLQFLKYDNQDMIHRFNGSWKLKFRPSSERQFISLSQSYSQTTIADTVLNSNIQPSYIGDGKKSLALYSTALEWELERRNNRLFPTEGTHYYAKFEEQIESGEHYNFMVDLETSSYLYLSRKVVLGLGTQFHYSSIDNPPYFNLPALGYDHFVRGFENYVVTGQTYAVGKSSLRRQLIKKNYSVNQIPLKNYKTIPFQMYGGMHIDLGYIENRTDDPQNQFQNSALIGYGLGLEMLFYNEKLIRFEYSFTNKNTNGLFIHFKNAF